jgi:hypothetical protein
MIEGKVSFSGMGTLLPERVARFRICSFGPKAFFTCYVQKDKP